jgi:hypothetical protein
MSIELSPVRSFADEVLVGNRLIEAVFGPQRDAAALKKARRRLYHLASEVPLEDRLPLFRLGPRILAGRPSTLLEWVAERERRALAALKIETAAAEPPALAAPALVVADSMESESTEEEEQSAA